MTSIWEALAFSWHRLFLQSTLLLSLFLSVNCPGLVPETHLTYYLWNEWNQAICGSGQSHKFINCLSHWWIALPSPPPPQPTLMRINFILLPQMHWWHPLMNNKLQLMCAWCAIGLQSGVHTCCDAALRTVITIISIYERRRFILRRMNVNSRSSPPQPSN